MKLSRSSKAQSSATMPDWKPEIRRRLANLQLPPTREAAIVEELAQRLDESYAELLVSFRRVVLVRRESRLYVCFGLRFRRHTDE